MGRDPCGGSGSWLGIERPLTSERRGGKLVWRRGEARLKVADVLVLMMMKVKDVLVLDVLMLMVMMMKVVKVLLEVKVMVKEFVVVEVLLFSLSSTPFPRTTPSTRPAGRVWAWGAKGSGFPIVLPAPGRRCSGPFS